MFMFDYSMRVVLNKTSPHFTNLPSVKSLTSQLAASDCLSHGNAQLYVYAKLI